MRTLVRVYCNEVVGVRTLVRVYCNEVVGARTLVRVYRNEVIGVRTLVRLKLRWAGRAATRQCEEGPRLDGASPGRPPSRIEAAPTRRIPTHT